METKKVVVRKLTDLLGSPLKSTDHDISRIKDAIASSLKLLSYDISKFANKTVILLPNLVRPNPEKIPASSTDPRVILAMVRLLKEARASRIQVGEKPGYGFSSRKAFEAAHLIKPLEAEGAEIMYFDELDWVDVPNPEGRLYRLVKYAKPVLDADVVVNMPKWKTHMLTNVSLSIKNLLGNIHDNHRMLFHRNDIIDKIVDLALVRPPDLNILDGLWAMEGQAPFHGETIKDFNCIGISADMTALDIAASAIMGFQVYEVPHLMLAKKRLWGGIDYRIEVLGEGMMVSRPFNRPVLSSAGQFPVECIECGVCNGCLSAIRHSLDKIAFEGGFQSMPEVTIVSGRSMMNQITLETWKGQLILFGNCAAEFQFYDLDRRQRAIWIAGCPPHVLDLEKVLRTLRLTHV